jgi:type IV pilus assembly protein PilW
MSTPSTRRPARRRSRGLSLIEILVGLVIGMIGIVVIFQVLAVSESRKRTTVQGSDAQSAGAIGLYSLQRDVQLGGYGFGGADSKQIGCLVRAYDVTPPGKAIDFRLYPVEIIQGENLPTPGAGAAGSPDVIRVLWGNSNQFVTTRAWTVSGAMATISGGRAGLDYGDLLVLTGDPPSTPGASTECALVQVTDRPVLSNDIGHDLDYNLLPGPPPETLPPGATNPPRFNKDATTWPASVFTPTSGFVLNLGKQPRRVEWSINANRLMVAETLFGLPTVEAADGIINLQAEYGIDRNNNQVIDPTEWTETPPNNTLIPADPANPCADSPPVSWRCVRAVRVALLARSTQWDKTACSPNPQWTSGVDGGGVSVPPTLKPFVMSNVDGTADTSTGCPNPASPTDPNLTPNNWRLYRYSVYETVIPLRNMIWGTAP